MADTKKADKPKWVIHPILFAIYPVVMVFSGNLDEVRLDDLPLPGLVALGLGVGIWLVAGLLLRSVTKGGLVSSLSVVTLLLYMYAYEIVSHLTRLTPSHTRGVSAWLAAYTIVLVLIILSKPRIIGAVTRFCNVFSAVLVGVALASIAAGAFGSGDGRVETSEQEQNRVKTALSKWARADAERPSIYYIILDGYARADMLREIYAFDNSEFLNALKTRGFFVADKSTSNYASTNPSLEAALDMEYPPIDRKRRWRTNMVLLLMHGIGYEYVLVPSGYPHRTDNPHLADVVVDTGVETRSQISALLIERSLFRFVGKGESEKKKTANALKQGFFKDLDGCIAWHDHIEKSIEAIGALAAREGPTFTFAHVLCPHPPFVFNRDGSVNTRTRMADLSDVGLMTRWSSKSEYVDQLIYVNGMLKRMVDRILADSQRPVIIILQSDHGTFTRCQTADSFTDPSDGLVRERLANLLACYASEAVRKRLYPTITPVNLFRVIFNEQFGAQYPLLEDRNYWSFGGSGWSYREVTDIVVGPGGGQPDENRPAAPPE